ncbi:MAG TPA: sigma-54 dependent transcriptional regulator [Candidatus Sulfotelmatobacter sp.]|nr:sigma-54 dependent transcriptional regulator [Candidatus Sulfotelmatobacter sp.]
MKTATQNRHRILLADDQADIRESLRLLLKNEGFETQLASSPAEVLAAIEAREFDAVLMDLNYTRDTTSGQEGLDLLSRIQSLDSTLPVIVMTAWSSVELAVEAMRLGASDFLPKPWENARLLSILRTQIDLRQALRRATRLEAENRLLSVEARPTMIADSAAMQPVLNLIARIGPSDANVLITGEHGTGKEVVARTLHAMSGRSNRPMVTVNAGGLSSGLFESELFGHVKGAFTDARVDRIGRFEIADSGTLFLDEIANVPLNLQSKLLRVLETGEFERVGSSNTRRVNVRVLAATNVDVNAEVAAGRFREDLLFRLNTIEIHLPSLRERGDDIELLANHFLLVYTDRYRKKISGFDAGAMQSLREHPWPGNVRELDHAVERAVLLSTGPMIRGVDLGLRATSVGGALRLEEMSLEEVEKHLIQRMLARHGGNVSKAAEALGLSRSALYRRLQKFGLE